MNPKQKLSIGTLTHAMLLTSLPTIGILLLLVMGGQLDFLYYIYAVVGVIALSGLIVIPALNNLATLTQYVNNLAQDKRVRFPELEVLKNFSGVADALARLQKSWDKQKQEMETVITEREILVDTLPDILIMTNFDKIIVRTNRAARNIFGQNLAGKHIRSIIPNDKLMMTIDAVIEEFHGREQEFSLDGNPPRDFQAVVERFPIPSEGGISIIVTLNDITQQKRIQRMRADFVANASHEIRTPLASIIGFIETLRGPAKDDPQAREEFLKVMADQAERMSKLINDLLSLSKIEMNAHNMPVGKVDMLRLVRSEKQQLEWAASQKGINLRIQHADNLPPVMGEEDELAQVVRNLMGNAVKYTHQGTDVTVTIKLTSDFPKEQMMRGLTRALAFSVQDHGDGIPKEHIPRLTERFYRVDSARTRKVGGTGLGLSIVKHVLNRHSGALKIESEPGKGSVFSAYLPLFEDMEKGRQT